MKIKAIRIKNNKVISGQSDREVKAAIIIISLFCASMIIGAGFFRINTKTVFDKIFESFLTIRADEKFLRLFLQAVIINGILISVTFFFGLSCFGMPVIMAIPILHGLGFGLTAGYLIKNYSFNGMGYYLLTIFPSGIITVSAMVLSASLAVTSSCELLSVILEKQQPDSKQLNVYFKKFLLLLITVFISASADTVFTKAFSGLFIF